ncbi:MAG: cell division protein ZapA [Burkholderiaceae bacterium]
MEHLTVTILEREYRIACTPDERDSLLRCAAFVESKMQSIRAAGKLMGADRIAVMAALQIAHELMNAKTTDGIDAVAVRTRLREMVQSCDDALLPQEKLF